MKRKDLIRQIGELKCALLDASKRINELERENSLLTERQKNADHNRQWCDDATNWLGPWAKHRLAQLESLFKLTNSLRADLGEISDAYHTVEGSYPWEDQ